jgi:hypothetical protein
MSSKGEIQLREEILQALLDINAIGDPDQLLGYVDAALDAVKRNDYFARCGTIYEVTWDNIVDFQDERYVWSIATEAYDREDDDYDDEDI